MAPQAARPATVESLLTTTCSTAVVIVDVPAGHGRSSLLHDLVHALPSETQTSGTSLGSVVKVLVVVRPSHAKPGALGRAIAERLDASRRREDPLDAVLQRLGELARTHAHVVVVVDEAHRSGEDGNAFLSELARSLPPNAHLVLGGTGLRHLHLTDLELDGRVVRVGRESMPFRTPEANDRLVALFRDAAARDASPPQRRLLAVLVALDLSAVEQCSVAAEALEETPSDLRSLDALPGIEFTTTTIELHPAWQFVRENADRDDVRRVAGRLGVLLLESEATIADAGRLSLVAESVDVLRGAVRRALSAQPPLVSAHDLRTWLRSGLLADGDPHRTWLSAATGASMGATLDEVFERYDEARIAFVAADDVDAEVAVGMAAAIVARRRNDVLAVAIFIGRATELAASGHANAVAPARFGEALALQMSGDPAGALGVLDRIPPGALTGDWAAQLLMMRGTNLLLLGRLTDAATEMQRATGWGSAYSHIVALDLLAYVRWRLGDGNDAIEDLVAAEQSAADLGADPQHRSLAALRAVMERARGDDASSHAGGGTRIVVEPSVEHDLETRRLRQVDAVFRAIGDDDRELARQLVANIDAPERALRSTAWTLALQVALQPDSRPRWTDVVKMHPALQVALDAGDSGERFLREGTPAPASCRAFLPWSWCDGFIPVVEVRLIGMAELRRNGRTIVHPAWDRARVRELLVYLAIHPAMSRERIASALWPELPLADGQRNLRVTLTYLADVLDPDRERGSGSSLIVEKAGLLSLSPGLFRIDIRRQSECCADVLAAAHRKDRAALLAAARLLARFSSGPLLGGTALGEWIEPFLHERRELLLGALTVGGAEAQSVGDAHLTLALARLGLREDPWAERLHELVIEAHVHLGDVDAARRAVRHSEGVFGEIGLRPGARLRALARSIEADRSGDDAR
jgi:DNA-binding SARP family transcriptional activator